MKRTISNYIFNTVAKTVTFTDFTTIRLESILLITNVTRNTIIYQLTATGMGGTVATNVLTLAANTTGQADADKLNIIFEDFVSGGVVSVANSTATNLALNAVFTGASEEVLSYSNIKINITSSHASATDGLQIQQSSDGVNWDESNNYNIPAATNRTFSIAVNQRYFRIVYTNGSTATTSLRIQVIFSTQDKQPSSVRPQDARPNDNDFVENLGFLMGYNSTLNTWDRLRSTITDGLAVEVKKSAPLELSFLQADIHGQSLGVGRITQVTAKFFQQPPSSFLNISALGGAAATGPTSGLGVFSTGTATTASLLAQTPTAIMYSTAYEAWASQAALFTAPTLASSFQRLGIYDAVNGYFFGFSGLNFGLTARSNSVDTFIPKTSWNTDTLIGAVGSKFTSNNVPVALIPTNINMYRVRYGWYGAVTARLEVYSPDGTWVLVHLVRTANTVTTANITNPDLPMTLEVSKTASDATDLRILTGGWAAGITAPDSGPLLSGQGSIAALNAFVAVPTTGLGALSFSLIGTWVGTLTFQYSLDGLNWHTETPLNTLTGAFLSTTTANGSFTSAVGSFKFYRILATAWTSGSASIIYNGSLSSNLIVTQSLITDGPGGVPATVRPASTAAVAADAALVVALHPTSPLPVGTNAIGNINELRAAPLALTAIGAAGAAVTLTIPAVAGQFHYFSSIDIVLYSAAARTGSATPNTVTTTNLPGAIAFTFSTAGAIGTTDAREFIRVTPLKSAVVNTATTVVAPIAAGGIWRIRATYFTGA